MVGVAGKYKGCNSCRIRRVKCDGQRPICKKCISTKRECGYERATVFIVGTEADQGRCSSHPHRSQILNKKKKTVQEPTPPSSSSQSSPTVTRRNVSWADESSPPQSVDDSSQYRLQFLVLHEQCLVQERLYGIENGGNSFGTAALVRNLPEFTFHSPALDCSLLSLSLLSMVRKNQDPRLVEASKLVVSDALVKLRIALRDARGVKTTGTLAASMCLFLYDSGDSGPLVTWKGLVEDAKSLLKELGAFSFRKFPEQQLFVQLFRQAILWQALESRQTTFLSLPEWTTVPWEEISKTPSDTLIDQMIALPMLLERAHSLQSTTSSLGRRLKILDFLQNCFRIDKSFQTWYQATLNSPESIPHWSTASPNPFAASPIFPTTFAFTTFQNALLHINFWASLILLYTAIFDTHALLSEPYFSNTSGMSFVRPNNQAIDDRYAPDGVRVLASNICQSLAFSLGYEVCGLGVEVVAPIFCVRGWFGRRISGGREDAWCVDLLGRLSARSRLVVEMMRG